MANKTFPSVVTSAPEDAAASAVIDAIALVVNERFAENKADRVPANLLIMKGRVLGLHIKSDPKLKKLWTLRYSEEPSGLYVLPIHPSLIDSPLRMKNLAYEIVAMVKRGLVKWQEKKNGQVTRQSLTAYGMERDEEKYLAHKKYWEEVEKPARKSQNEWNRKFVNDGPIYAW